MGAERQILETVAHCVGILIFYQNQGTTKRSRALMADELRSTVGWMVDLGVSDEALESLISEPVRAELLARYGPAIAFDLHAEFVQAIGSPQALRLMKA